VGDDTGLGDGAGGAVGAPAKATAASVPAATVLLLAGTGPRSGGAGGALRDTSGSTMAVGLSMPGGAFVVRFASGALQPPSAAAVATSISVSLEVFMGAPVVTAMSVIASRATLGTIEAHLGEAVGTLRVMAQP
jgi:hypothetical protein